MTDASAGRRRRRDDRTAHRPSPARPHRHVLVLVLSCWFAASAVVPALREAWEIGSGRATWLTAAVQLGLRHRAP